MTSLFLFTRDLRLNDNTALIRCLEDSEKVLPIFIFNAVQIDHKLNKYKSDNCVQFMCESLIDLNEELEKYKSRLFLFYGNPLNIIRYIINTGNITAVYMTQDYSPFAKSREESILNLCNKLKIKFNIFEDYSLVGINSVTKNDSTPYVKFTPYLHVAKKIKIDYITKNNHTNYVSSKTNFNKEFYGNLNNFYKPNDNIIVNGGRKHGLKILHNIKKFDDYNNTRDIPIYETTHLSAYLKFGCVSIREAYWTMKNNLTNKNKLFTQLFWRDFFMTILYHFPHVIGNNMKENYHLKWNNNIDDFNAWSDGSTGIPFVDAGMREMNTTGYMHNRLRLVTSNFLIKILRIDWRYGERYFASKLVDYDVANNNLNWQWSASTAIDSQPYFRIFNPFRQSFKFDRDAEYIKKWIPELKNVDPDDIHNWLSTYKNYDLSYPDPIIKDMQKEVSKTIKMYTNRK